MEAVGELMFLEAFSGKTVLVTGHTGFKGGWLSIWLEQLGADVVGYALSPPTDPSLFEHCNIPAHLQHIEADLRNTERLKKVLAELRPDFIFHLAAQSLVLTSYAEPNETFETNIMGTISLLEAMRALQMRCVAVLITTDKVYENRECIQGYSESDPLGGHDPYSASKAAMEIVVASYRKSFFNPTDIDRHGVSLATARAGNVIGGGDWAANRIVPDAIRALSAGEKFEVRHPRSRRPWQHVLEPLSGYLWLAALLGQPGGEQYAAAWNFGPLPEQQQTVGQLAEAIVTAWGEGAWYSGEYPQTPHEASTLELSIDKALARLSWEPVWDFRTTVERTVRWYKQSSGTDSKKCYQLVVDDISGYQAAAESKHLPWIS